MEETREGDDDDEKSTFPIPPVRLEEVITEQISMHTRTKDQLQVTLAVLSISLCLWACGHSGGAFK